MTYEVYRYIFIGAAVLSGIMAITSIFLFFYLKISRVIGDLTGSTARKAIEEIRQQNESSGHKTYKSSLVNQERGRLTDKISPSGNLYPAESDPLGGAMATEKIGTQQLEYSGAETELLSNIGSEETSVLSDVVVDAFIIVHEITFNHTDVVFGLEAEACLQ